MASINRDTTRIMNKNSLISDGFKVKEPRDSENIFARKRYTLIPSTTVWS